MLAHDGDLCNALPTNPEMTTIEDNVCLLRLRPQFATNQGRGDGTN